MSKQQKRLTLWRYLLAFMIGLSTTPLYSASLTHADVHINSAQLSGTKTNSTFGLASWFKPSAHKEIVIDSIQVGEIWGRFRHRSTIGATNSTPLIQRHLKSYVTSQEYINKLVRNATPYLFFILEEVEKRGMPTEIALLPMIESDFNPHCTSHRGATGIWQIMPTLGRMHGLKRNAWYDGRKDIYESTKVALDHLQYLHRQFNGNWLLALAAYNSGEAKVRRAISQNRSAKKATDFWSLKLPKETTNFVPKLIALATIIKSPKEYGVRLPTIPNRPVFTRVDTGKAVDITHAAKLADVSESQLRKLNPGLFKQSMNPSGPYHLLVPVQQANAFTLKAKSPPLHIKTKTEPATTTSAKSPPKIHIVKRGESIPNISKKYHLKVEKLLAYNQLKSPSSIIQPGQKLIIGESNS